MDGEGLKVSIDHEARLRDWSSLRSPPLAQQVDCEDEKVVDNDEEVVDNDDEDNHQSQSRYQHR